jgi:hypothetical protein
MNTSSVYEQLLIRQKQEAYMMEKNQIKGSVGEQPKLKAQITTQADELGMRIAHLEAVIDTLTHRLQPVLLDQPSTCRSEELVGGMSPVAAAFFEANQRVTRASDNLQDILERLEV